MLICTCRGRLTALPYFALVVLLSIWVGTKWRPQAKLPHWIMNSPGKTADENPFHFLSDTDDLRQNFIVSATKAGVQRKWDPHPIQKLCASRTWTNDVVFQCIGLYGGISNVRQELLTCIRWAMEAGAAIVFPRIKLRVASNASQAIYHKYEGDADFKELFDRETLSGKLSEACPQMIVHLSVEALEQSAVVEKVGVFRLKDRVQKDEMGPFVKKWIDEHRAAKGSITLMQFQKNMSAYEVCNDGPEIADTFGQLVALRKDTTYLASAVLYELSARYKLKLDPSSKITPSSLVGVHLRTSADAVKQGWLSFEEQVRIYGTEIAKYNPVAVYVASGNLTSVNLFAATLGTIPVVTKNELLSGKELDLLNALSWDQQGEIDLQVLLKSAHFLGMSDSSFSWAVSGARRSVGHRGTCSEEERDHGKQKPVERDVAYKDEMSIIIGPPNELGFRTRMWA